MVKENELTKKPIEELIDNLRKLTEIDFLRQYLETLLYKVEVASTENSFNSMKRKVAEPLVQLQEESTKEFERATLALQKGERVKPRAEGASEEGSAKPAAGSDEEYLAMVQAKADILKEYNNLYFLSADFVFVEKNLLQFKKAKAEQSDKNANPVMSDEYLATIEKRLIVQLITAFKKAYNQPELWLLKTCMLKDLLKQTSDSELDDGEYTKYATKKKVVLEALKRIRMDMVSEDTQNTASTNKKNFIETFETELMRLPPKDLRRQVLPVAEKKSDDLVSRAKRHMAKKAESVEQAKEEDLRKDEIEQEIGLYTIRTALDLYVYNSGKLKTPKFQEISPAFDVRFKEIEGIVKKMEKGDEKETKRGLVVARLRAFQEAMPETSRLDEGNARMFQIYLKGVIGRCQYW